MIRIGLFGAGKIAQIHAEAYQKIEGVEVRSVVDVNRQSADLLSLKLGAKAYYDLDTFLDRVDIDIADICLPTFLHGYCVIGAAQRGKHVICEKPISLDINEVDQMIDAVQKAGVKSMVGQVVRFNPEYRQIREKTAEGVIGKPLVYTTTRRAELPNWGGWFKDPNKSGGALFDLHVHDIDYIYSILGLPESVYAAGLQDSAGAWNYVMTSLNYPGCKAFVESSYMFPSGYPFQMGLRVLGQAGCIEYNYIGGQVEDREKAKQGITLYRSGEIVETIPRTGEDGFLSELRYFTDCVKNDKPVCIATLQQAKEVLSIIYAIRKSLETGEAVRL